MSGDINGDSMETDTDADTTETDTQPDENVDLEDDTDIIFIGNKSPMKYVQAAMTSFNQGHDKVVLKSRGRAISTAVDTAEILRREFMEDVDIEDIEISTEEIEDDDGEEIKLSSMRITME
ncbi:MAG: DNA-binding protein Alba [Halobacteria archaeon]|nr:DNA-binding protein Alba [Halobacteria archaeon]